MYIQYKGGRLPREKNEKEQGVLEPIRSVTGIMFIFEG